VTGVAADAVLFDLDGVIVDSRVPFARCVNAALREHGLPERPAEDLHAFIGPPLHETFGVLGAGERAQACVEAYRRHYRALAADTTPVMPGMREVLSELSARLPIALATSKSRALAEPLLAALGLRSCFSAVCGPSLAAMAEPKAETIGRALAELPGVRHPVMVGDREYDVIGARAHGLPTIGVLWGIGSAEELRAAGAWRLAAAAHELPALVASAPAPSD
jgi:phosphoglycolate phosphatase